MFLRFDVPSCWDRGGRAPGSAFIKAACLMEGKALWSGQTGPVRPAMQSGSTNWKTAPLCSSYAVSITGIASVTA